MEYKHMSREEVEQALSNFKVSTTEESHDGDILNVVYESFKAQAKGLEPHPKSYTGVLEEVRITKTGDLLFVLGNILEKNGQYRGFNPSKGWVISMMKVF